MKILWEAAVSLLMFLNLLVVVVIYRLSSLWLKCEDHILSCTDFLLLWTAISQASVETSLMLNSVVNNFWKISHECNLSQPVLSLNLSQLNSESSDSLEQVLLLKLKHYQVLYMLKLTVTSKKVIEAVVTYSEDLFPLETENLVLKMNKMLMNVC